MNSKTVLLINVPTGDMTPESRASSVYSISAGVPLGLLSLGTVLKQNGYDVEIVDWLLVDDYYEKIRSSAKGSLLVGLTLMTPGILPAMEICRLIRQSNPAVPIIFGGIHPTLFPEETCQNELVDIVVYGEGENILLNLADHFSGKRPFALADIKGIVYKEGSASGNAEVVKTPPDRPVDVDDLPAIDYSLIPVERVIDKKVSVIRDGRAVLEDFRHLQVFAGFGCPFKCSFCINTILYQETPWRGKSADRLLQEIDDLVEEYGVEFIRFRDENFFSNRRRVVELVDGLLKRPYRVKWFANVRADYFTGKYINDDFLGKLKESGFAVLSMGVETGSERMKTVMNKPLKRDRVIESARLALKHGIYVEYSFMTSLPGEEKSDMVDTLQLIVELHRMNSSISIIGPQHFRPYPGSALFDACVENGLELPKTFEDWGRFMNRDLTVFDLPWIANPHLVLGMKLMAVIFTTQARKSNALKSFVMKLLYMMNFIRFKAKLFYLPTEIRIYMVLPRFGRFMRSLTKV
jgi:anaerobic magnesium-protoporphyrin IX monomethyl ester cyclase